MPAGVVVSKAIPNLLRVTVVPAVADSETSVSTAFVAVKEVRTWSTRAPFRHSSVSPRSSSERPVRRSLTTDEAFVTDPETA